MDKFKSLFVVFFMTAMLFNSGCSRSADSPPPTGVPYYPNYPTNVGSCQIGQIYSTQYGCLNQGNCPQSYGWAPSISQCVQGTLVTAQNVYGTALSTGRFYSTLSITNPAQFALLLKYANLCDPYWTGWNWGAWSCDNYSSAGFIQLQYFSTSNAATSNATLFIGAGAGFGGNYSYFQFGNSYMGFSQTARVSDGNNSQGMYIDGINYTGVNVGLKLVVANGNFIRNPSLTSFSADVYYQNVKFAVATFSRY